MNDLTTADTNRHTSTHGADMIQHKPTDDAPATTDTYRRDPLEVARAVYRDAPHLARFLDEIRAERAAQIAKWGDQRHPDGTSPDFVWAFTGPAGYVADCVRDNTQFRAEEGVLSWRDILLEEVAEAFEQADPVKLRAELVQVAAVCGAWISDLDRRPAGRAPGERGTAVPRTLVFADEDDAVHLASGDGAECGATGGGRATCLASVTCRDCLDAFHAPAAPRPFRVGDPVEITGRDGGEVCASSGANLNGRTGVVSEIDDNPKYPIGLSIEGFVGLVWCSSTEIRHADPASAAAHGSGAAR